MTPVQPQECRFVAKPGSRQQTRVHLFHISILQRNVKRIRHVAIRPNLGSRRAFGVFLLTSRTRRGRFWLSMSGRDVAGISRLSTSRDSLPASPPPARAPRRSESAAPYPSPDNTSPSSAIPAGSALIPARTEKLGIAWVSPDGWNSRHPAGTYIANRAAPANAADSWCDRRTCARTPPRSYPRTAPRAGRRPPPATLKVSPHEIRSPRLPGQQPRSRRLAHHQRQPRAFACHV